MKGEEAESGCASGPQGEENIFSGLGLKERLGCIHTRPSHFCPFWLRHTVLKNLVGLAKVGQQMPLRSEMSTCD